MSVALLAVWPACAMAFRAVPIACCLSCKRLVLAVACKCEVVNECRKRSVYPAATQVALTVVAVAFSSALIRRTAA
jgi:hypothetical protein